MRKKKKKKREIRVGELAKGLIRSCLDLRTQLTLGDSGTCI